MVTLSSTLQLISTNLLCIHFPNVFYQEVEKALISALAMYKDFS